MPTDDYISYDYDRPWESAQVWRRCPQCGIEYPRNATYFHYVNRKGHLVPEYCNGNGNGCHDAYARQIAARRRVKRSGPRVGLEIEFVGDANRVVRSIKHTGLRVEWDGYTHDVMRRWKVVSDGSVPDGGELVSPPLVWNDATKDRLKRILAATRTWKGELLRQIASVDYRCGLHVHVDVSDCTSREIINIISQWSYYEDLILRTQPESRHSGSWCQSILDVHQDLRYKYRDRDPSLHELRGFCNDIEERYFTLNPVAYFQYGTLELRVHSGTLNYNKIVSWVEFCRAFFTWARLGEESSFETLEELFNALHPHGLSDEAALMLLARAASFASHARRGLGAGRRGTVTEDEASEIIQESFDSSMRGYQFSTVDELAEEAAAAYEVNVAITRGPVRGVTNASPTGTWSVMDEGLDERINDAAETSRVAIREETIRVTEQRWAAENDMYASWLTLREAFDRDRYDISEGTFISRTNGVLAVTTDRQIRDSIRQDVHYRLPNARLYSENVVQMAQSPAAPFF